mgnify:CR=1 FL=1
MIVNKYFFYRHIILTLNFVIVKTNSIKRLLSLLIISFFVLSCAEDEAGYGNYIIGVSNATSDRI